MVIKSVFKMAGPMICDNSQMALYGDVCEIVTPPVLLFTICKP